MSQQHPDQHNQHPQHGHQPPGGHVPAQPGPQGGQGQQPPQGGPMSTVALTIQGSMMTSSMVVPTVKINGHWIHTQYGRQDVPVPAGPVHVEASGQWMRTYGQASLDFTAQPGQVVPVFYAAPWHQFTTGSMGHEKQSRKGVGALIGVLSFVVLMIMCLVLMPLLSGM